MTHRRDVFERELRIGARSAYQLMRALELAADELRGLRLHGTVWFTEGSDSVVDPETTKKAGMVTPSLPFLGLDESGREAGEVIMKGTNSDSADPKNTAPLPPSKVT